MHVKKESEFWRTVGLEIFESREATKLPSMDVEMEKPTVSSAFKSPMEKAKETESQ